MKILYANPERHDYLHAVLIRGLVNLPEVELWSLNQGNYGGLADRCLDGDVHAALDGMESFDVVILGSEGKFSEVSPEVQLIADAETARKQRRVFVDSGDLGSLPTGVRWGSIDTLVKRELFLESPAMADLVSNAIGRRLRHGVEYQFRRHPLLAFPNVHCNAMARPAAVSFHRRRQWRLPSSVAVRCEPIGIEPRLIQTPEPSPHQVVTCTLTPNTEPRRAILAHLEGRKDVLVGQVPPAPSTSVDLVALGAVSPRRPSDHVHNSAYLERLRAHRASISFPGAGFDTARFWEILGAGALLISKRVSLDLPVPIVDGVHYLGFDTLIELDETIEFAMSEPEEADRIRLRGHEHAITHYSSSAIAERTLASLAS